MSDMNHVVPVRTYLIVFAALLVLTFVTVEVAYLDLGRFNVLVALTIACLKATVVLMFFMHLKYGPQLNVVVAGAAGIWLLLMFIFTITDFLTRTPVPGTGF